MSANIAKTDGKDAVFMVKTPAWHGLGQVVQEAQKSMEAMKLAGLDWEVDGQPVYLHTSERIADYKAQVRRDTGVVLGIVGKGYETIQNAQAFEFMDSLVGSKQAMYHTAGALGRGERVWMQVKLPGTVTVAGIKGDLIEKFLLLSNSHDGSSAIRVFFTPTRVICMNTLNQALHGEFTKAKKGLSVRHTANATERMKQAKKVLEISVRYFDDFENKAGIMASKQINEVAMKAYFGEVLGIKEDSSTRKANILQTVIGLSETAPGQDMARGSVWNAYNALTYYVSHERGTRGESKEERANNRLDSIWFGSGATLNERAWSSALELVK